MLVHKTTFNCLGLTDRIVQALKKQQYAFPTPIQEKAIPLLIERNDLLGIAQTGTGKTAAFGLPILHHLSLDEKRPMAKSTRALILAPTRELAVQIGDALKVYGRDIPLRHTVVFGGVGQNAQVTAMRRGVDILVATPGRLLDLFNQKHIRLDFVSYFVLDEADRMLDMGFIHDVQKITALLPTERQTLLFSATMPPGVIRLANKILHNPREVSVAPTATPVKTVEQKVIFIDREKKRSCLVKLLQEATFDRVIVFTRTKHKAGKLAEQLTKSGIKSDSLHGDKSQSARQKALALFKSGKVSVLVATDIASRGIDVDDVTHVINYELPVVPEDYVHRIGRTARAGASGSALSLCDKSEIPHLTKIEQLIKTKIEILEGERPQSEPPERSGKISKKKRKKRKKSFKKIVNF